MTAAEYEKLFGQKYDEKRKFKAIKINYAKPSAVFAALGQIKSDIGKLVLDEPSATIFAIDIPEKLILIQAAASELDKPQETNVFTLQYANADDIKPEVEALLTKGTGEAVIDKRSNKIIVSDLPDKLKRIANIINELDTEQLQVLIECNIVQIDFKNENQSQINWEAVISDLKLTKETIDAKGAFPVSASWTTSQTLATANQSINVGTLGKDRYTAALQFLETLGSVKIHSTPELLVVNNHEGNILVGTREAYVIQTLSQATGSTISSEDIKFIDVGVKLNVTPSINSNGFITMKIKPSVSSVRNTITTKLGSVVPIVDTSGVETSVKVKDGVMIMIAGLTQQQSRTNKSGVPGLFGVPLVNAALGSSAQLKEKTEFVVFLTPHIVKGDKNAVPAEYSKDAKTSTEVRDKLKGMKIAEVD
jgi:general secretion pathway protein D